MQPTDDTMPNQPYVPPALPIKPLHAAAAAPAPPTSASMLASAQDVNAASMTEATTSAVSWSAVIAGALVAAAVSLSLMAFGLGVGLSAVSPWSQEGASAASIGTASIVWLIIMQLIAAMMGGYLAGRLRTKWVDTHRDEVFFRDTAHGFLVWALGLVVTASVLASAAASVVNGVAKAGNSAMTAAAVGGAALASGMSRDGSQATQVGTRNNAQGATLYLLDSMFRMDRQDRPTVDPNDAATRAESLRILTSGLAEMPAADRIYLAQLIAAKTGVSQAEAEKRVFNVIAQINAREVEARQLADTARKAAMKLSIWIFIGLLIGAFAASFAATIGGRQRDLVTA